MENTSPFTIRPMQKPLFQIQAEQSHPRLSLRRVLYVKFLRWVEKAPSKSLWMACAKCSMLVLALCVAVAPSFALGLLTASARWNGYRLPIMAAIVAIVLNAQRLWHSVKKFSEKRRTSIGKATAYHGIPLDELISYLFERRRFGIDAMADFGLSQRKWSKIAEELESHGVLTRGENNSRVLAEIDRGTLVRQLRDGFPLVFDPVGKAWVERRGSFDQWVLSRERQQKKEEERTEKLGRKQERLRGSIEKLKEEHSVFRDVMALTH